MAFPVVMYHVQMWELDHKEDWAPKNWCFQIVVLEKTIESLGLQGDKPINPKGNQPWIFIERTDAEAEAPIVWPPDAKSQLIRKDLDAGKDWGQKKGAAEHEMVGYYHRFNGYWVNSRRQWRTGKPGMLQCMGSQKSRTELRDSTTIKNKTLETCISEINV